MSTQATFEATVEGRGDLPDIDVPVETISNATLRHSALSNIDIQASGLTDEVRDYATFFAPVELRVAFPNDNRDAERIFRGQLVEVEQSGSSAITTLKTVGRLIKLEKSAGFREFADIRAFEALRQYIDEETPFEANVEDDPGTSVVDDGLAFEASTQPEFEDFFEVEPTDAFEIENGVVKTLQSNFVVETPDADTTTSTTIEREDFSRGEGEQFDSVNRRLAFDISTEYEIESPELAVRFEEIEVADSNGLEVLQDGDFVGDLFPPESLGWITVSLNPITDSAIIEIQPLGLEDEEFGVVDFDVVSVRDSRFDYFDDNEVHEPNGFLDGPELYLGSAALGLNTATSRQKVTEGRFASTWDDTTNNQYVEVSPDGSDYTRFDNTANATFSFGSSTDSIDTNLGFSRYPVDTNPQSATPRFGYNGQSVDLWELFVNPETPRADDIGETIARAIIPPNTAGIVNETVKEAGLKSDGQLLTRHELASFELLLDQRLASSETTRFSGDN